MKKIITRIAMTATLLSLMIMALPASASIGTTINLAQKDTTTWNLIPDGKTASVTYSTDINGKFFATWTGVSQTDYTLIYYPDTSTYTGESYPVIGTNMNLPMAGDTNSGAKLWLVPNADISSTINTNGSQTINWSDASNFLFDTSLINYTATPITQTQITQTQKNITTWVPILNGINADVAISTVSGKFSATGIPDGYTLVYYPNVGTYSNYTGEVYPVVGTNMTLPMASDLNGGSSSNYCTSGLNPNAGSNCKGAKLWLVPNADISSTINANGSQTLVGDWNTIAPNILFETNLINYTATTPTTYTLTYTAGANGTITGTSTQTVNSSASGTIVTAIPSAGYSFINWSDSSTTNPRTDTTVAGNISVTANFAATSVTSNPTTQSATAITSTDATLNGTNGSTPADNTSFWLGTTQAGPFTAGTDPGSSQLPSGWSHDNGLGSVLTGGTFSNPLTGLTPNTSYYFVAWSLVGGTWYPGTVLNFTTGTTTETSDTITGTVTSGSGVLHVDSITASANNANGVADGTYGHGWSYIFHITAPTNEPNLSLKFADWSNGTNILPVANNMRISSAQATITTPTTLTAANLYSSPALVMTGDLDSNTAGRQVDVLVETQIPLNTVNGSYSTSYGINTN